MKKSKSLMLILSIILLFILLFSACSKKGNDSSTQDSGGISNKQNISGNNTGQTNNYASGDASGSNSPDYSEQGANNNSPTGNSKNNGGGAVSTTKKNEANNNGGSSTSKTLYVKDFGAKADGKTDDAEAIMISISKLSSGGTLIFESNKTYFASNNGTSLNSILTLVNMKNITIKGNNTTLLIGEGKYYARVDKTENLTIEGFNFEYRVKPAFRATAESVNVSAKTAIVKADRDVYKMENGDVYLPPQGWFGALDKPDGRYHMYITSYKMIDKASRKLEITFSDEGGTASRISQLNQNDLTAPMPYIGHQVERAFEIWSSKNFKMVNCNVYSISRFGFMVNKNDGPILFKNVNIVKGPSSIDQKLNFVGWRDGYHCKENRGKITWDNCKAEGLYDDVHNISVSTMYIRETNGEKNEIDMFWPETSGTYAPLQSGDKLSIINTKTGEFIGEAQVSRVMKQSGSTNRIKLNKSLAKLETGEHIKVFIDSMAAPGSEIKNCNFDGTFRFRGPITISNSKFYNRRMWIGLETSLEGPLPKDIIFKNCELTCDNTSSKFFHIQSANTSKSPSAYKIKNVVFENCRLSKANFEIGPIDEVKFIG